MTTGLPGEEFGVNRKRAKLPRKQAEQDVPTSAKGAPNPDRLTPEEIESLREDLRQAEALLVELAAARRRAAETAGQQAP